MKAVRVGEILQICIILALSMMVTSCTLLEPKQRVEQPVKGEAWMVPELDMEFVPVQAGIFEMGAHKDDTLNFGFPVHEVKITQPFWFGKYEVTQGEYKELMGENPSHFKGDRKPVQQLAWDKAEKFCKKLTKREHEAGRLPEGYVYRLPTEAEWEYAARGGQASEGYKYSGSNDIDEVAWYWRNSGEKRLKGDKMNKFSENDCSTHAVGKKAPNKLGIHDMSGNVAEWCRDWFDGDYYKTSPRQDPVNTTEASCQYYSGIFFRVNRGGSALDFARSCRTSNRLSWKPDSTHSRVGFRVVFAPSVQWLLQRHPIHEAARKGNVENVKRLLRGKAALANKSGQNGITPLHFATSEGNVEVVKVLLENGAEINARNDGAYTPLYEAVKSGQKALAEILIRKGADVNPKSKINGKTPLHYVISEGQMAFVELLIDRGAEVNAKRDNGETLLHAAVKAGQGGIVELLINNGAAVNTKRENGETPLHDAAYTGHEDVAEVLIDNGAYVKIRADNGKTPLALAEEKNHDEFAELLRKHGGRK